MGKESAGEASPKKDKLSFKQVAGNNIFAVRLGGSISRSIVINSFFSMLTGYFEWVFFDGIFMKRVIGGLDAGEDYKTILIFIGLSGLFFFLSNAYYQYCECRFSA